MMYDVERLKSLTIRPESLQYYLARSGWREITLAGRTDVQRYELVEDPGVFVSIPRDIGTIDYKESVWRTIRTISQLEERDYATVFKNIYCPNLDTLKLRFMGTGADGGSLPLDYVRGAIDNIRDALIFSACSEISPQPMYARQLADAVRLVGKSRFGQTDIGSFVLSVEMPVEMPLATVGAPAADVLPPIERRVLTRVLKGLDTVKRVVSGAATFNPAIDYREGLNANLAESIASLRNADRDFQIELSAIWDRTLPPQTGIPTAPILIEERAFDTLTSIGQALRGPAVVREIEATGHVIGLSREDFGVDEEEDNEANTVERSITLQARVDGQTYKLKLILSPDEYRLACDAHRDRRQIYVRGALSKSGKRWLLTNHQNIRVLP